MSRPLLCILAILMPALPAQAEDFQTIGLIEAQFDGEALSQTTMSYLDEGQRLASASLYAGGALTALTIQGAEGKPIVIEASFTTSEPDPHSEPVDLTIGYYPSGLGPHWTSHGAPEPARIVFERLETGTVELHAAGTFEALLCHVLEVEDEPDTGNCRPITGHFDTQLFRE